MKTKLLFFLLCLSLASVLGKIAEIHQPPLEVDSADVKRAALYFLGKLQELSGSGIYDSMTIARINGARNRESKYHNLLEFDAVFSSEHLEPGEETVEHVCLVLSNKENGIKSISIDVFPIMKDESVREYQIKATKRLKEAREKLLAKLMSEEDDLNDMGVLKINEKP